MCITCMPSTYGDQKNVRSLETGVTEGCELSFGFWEPSLGLLQDHQVFLTRWAISYAPVDFFFLKKEFVI